jgi:hypothetical protein
LFLRAALAGGGVHALRRGTAVQHAFAQHHA